MTPASPMRCHGRPEHERVELLARERQRTGDILRPGELARVQAPGRQPDADAVVHQHLHPVGTAVGEKGKHGADAPNRRHSTTRASADSVPERMSSASTASQTASTRITAATRASSSRTRRVRPSAKPP